MGYYVSPNYSLRQEYVSLLPVNWHDSHQFRSIELFIFIARLLYTFSYAPQASRIKTSKTLNITTRISHVLGYVRGQLLIWNPVYKCPKIRPKIPEIQPVIPVIREIRPKISENRLENLKIRRKIPEIFWIRSGIPGKWLETLQIWPEITKIWHEIHDSRLPIAEIPDLNFLNPGLKSLKSLKSDINPRNIETRFTSPKRVIGWSTLSFRSSLSVVNDSSTGTKTRIP